MADSNRAAATCPLCGADNRCAIAAGAPPEVCWCHTVTLDAAAVARAAAVNEEQCICAVCGLSTEARRLAR